MFFKFRVIEACFNNASNAFEKNPDCDFFLEYNNWDDFGYHTTYGLHITEHASNKVKGTQYLGYMSIMRLSQQKGEHNILGNFQKKTHYTELPEDFLSMSFDIEIFEKINRLLDKNKRSLFAKTFHFIFDEDDELYKSAKDTDCFNKSFLRNGMDSLILKQAKNYILGDGTTYKLRKERITFKSNNSEKELTINFSPVNEDSSINGCISFIGKNGCGKSTTLYKLANLFYSDLKDRKKLSNLCGTINPSNIIVDRMIFLSYSPFDNFKLPIQYDEEELRNWKIKSQTENSYLPQTGRFIYAGIRNVSEESKNYETINADTKFDNLYSSKIILKDIDKLSDECYYICLQNPEILNYLIKRTRDFDEDLYSILIELNKRVLTLNTDSTWRDIFCKCSTGQKFFIHAMVHIYNYCMNNTLIFFDEPENHIQPPLLAFLLNEIKIILKERSSVMLITTHSPVVLQGLLSSNVFKVVKNDDKIKFQTPRIETFGESFSSITSEVFGLTTDKMYHVQLLNEMFDNLHCKNMNSVDQVIESFNKVLGDRLSNHTIDYIVGMYLLSK